MTIFTEAGYTERTVFKCTETSSHGKGVLVNLHKDDCSHCPYFIDSEGVFHYEYIPNHTHHSADEDLILVSLDGVKDGLLDKDGNLLFHTNKEWKKHKKSLKKRVTSKTTDIKVEDEVKIIACKFGHEFEIGSVVKVVGVNIGYFRVSDGYSSWNVHTDEIEKVGDEILKLKQKRGGTLETTPLSNNGLRTEDDYRSLTPDTQIKVVIDGHEAEVPLADILILKHVVGKCNGIYLDDTYSLLKNFDSDMDGLNLDFINISGMIEPYLNKYFNK